jgi:hypothetical protein
MRQDIEEHTMIERRTGTMEEGGGMGGEEGRGGYNKGSRGKVRDRMWREIETTLQEGRMREVKGKGR